MPKGNQARVSISFLLVGANTYLISLLNFVGFQLTCFYDNISVQFLTVMIYINSSGLYSIFLLGFPSLILTCKIKLIILIMVSYCLLQ